VTLTVPTVRKAVLDIAAPLVRGRVVLCMGAAARARRMKEFFLAAGADRVASVEIGSVPAETRQRFAAYEAALTAPDDTLQRELDAIDPAGQGLVYAGSYTAVRKVCGRPTIGARTPAHQSVERKDTQPAIIGAQAQRLIVGPELLDARRPAVVQGIPDVGIAMATNHTYLIPRRAAAWQLAALVAQLRRDCTTALIRPPDLGHSCTLYGFVAPDWVIDFGLVEALVYWHRHTWRIHAPGIARPMSIAPANLNTARATTHAVARRLHQQTGYVGAFGTDGVLHDNGYVLHEINPRVCAGFTLLDQLYPEAAPLAAADLVLREFGAAAATTMAGPLADAAQALCENDRFEFQLWDPGLQRYIASRVHKIAPRQAPVDIVRRILMQSDLFPLYDVLEGSA